MNTGRFACTPAAVHLTFLIWQVNTGLFACTPAARALAARWSDALVPSSSFANWRNDQQMMNELLRTGARPPPDGYTALAFNGTLRLGRLPSHLFPSGHVFFMQRQPHALHVRPYAVHLTFQNCDQSGKRHRMREAGLWLLDPPEYYDPPGGLLSYTPDLPPELTAGFAPLGRRLAPEDPMLGRHFQLIGHQLLQLRTALGLAHALNRTLVLPRFLCGLETVTNFAHGGLRCKGSPGCAMSLPYWCPADHVLRMHYWAGVMPQTPALRIRYVEHSALPHPRSRDPARRRVREGSGKVQGRFRDPARRRVVVAAAAGAAPRGCEPPVCEADGYLPGDAADAAHPPPDTRLDTRLEPPHSRRMRPAALRQWVAEHAGGPHRSPHLHFESLRPDAPHGGEPLLELPPAAAAQFEAFLLPLGGGWCCSSPERPGGPGHYWYDMLFDGPHTDRWGRVWTANQPWRPTPGP